MRVVINTCRIAMVCGVLVTPSLAAAQGTKVPTVPTVPTVPMVPMVPMIPNLSELTRLADLPRLADLSNLPELPMMLDAARLAASDGWLALDSARAVLAPDLYRFDGQRSPEEDARRREEQAKQRESERRQRVDEQYQRGQEALERRNWSRAADAFTSVVDAQNSTRVDAALYWKAYALDKLNQQADALTALGQMIKTYPQSRWIADAKALELQVRQNAGQAPRPEAESDEELKLLAIQGLQHSAPEQAVPMLEKILQGTASPQLKARALFVLAQSNSPRARQVLTTVAKGGSNPDVQRRAIQYLGVHGSVDNRAVLAEIYAGSNDVDIKRQILQSLFVGGDATRLIEVANIEQNVELRRQAVRHLGTMGRTRTGDALVAIYAREKDADIKRQVINAMFTQNNADSLVAIARKEADPALKREMVQKLSLMTKNKVAMDYLMEILNK
ncbi:MAG: HEAT repeat domain-containing protein [Acidobacteriota bacterium]|nr:HEAT repeat domain-containing protein [Acidobacteriota bacterium]